MKLSVISQSAIVIWSLILSIWAFRMHGGCTGGVQGVHAWRPPVLCQKGRPGATLFTGIGWGQGASVAGVRIASKKPASPCLSLSGSTLAMY